MSEKRFTLIKIDDYVFQIHDIDNDLYLVAEQICSLLNEQQSTISQLKQENQKLKKQNKLNIQLREINKEIGDDLYNCRANKNIISKALKLWQNTLAEYDIYTIKDFRESFELDAKINKEKDEKIKELEVKVLNLELELMKYE